MMVRAEELFEARNGQYDKKTCFPLVFFMSDHYFNKANIKKRKKMPAINIQNPSYADIVQQYFADNSTEIFPNGCEEHARVIIEQIFAHAQRYVYVLSNQLAESSWGGEAVLNAVRGALERGVEVRFAIQTGGVQTEGLRDLLDQFEITVTTGSNPDLRSNFIVSDDRMFRYEENRERVEAIASANRPDLAFVLRDYFRANVA